MGRNQLQQKGAALSPRQDLIDQPIVRCSERIDKSNSRQFKAILEVLGKQMANAGPLCCAPLPPKDRQPECLAQAAPLARRRSLLMLDPARIPRKRRSRARCAFARGAERVA
jgi:hypothetical protein